MTGFREKGPLQTRERTLAFSIHMVLTYGVSVLKFIGVRSDSQVNNSYSIHEKYNLLQEKIV